MPVPEVEVDDVSGGGVIVVDAECSFDTFDAAAPPPVLDVDERDGGERSEGSAAFDDRESSKGGRPPVTRGAGWCFVLGLLSRVDLRCGEPGPL